MKKFSFLMLAVAGMLFAACSSDKDVAEKTQVPGDQVVSQGFVALNIHLPSTPILRALNDSYDDGIAAEYKVTDACLFLYQKASTDAEGDATLVSAQALTYGTLNNTLDNDNVTTDFPAWAKILGTVDPSKDLLALVCVNYKDIITISNGKPTVAGTTLNKDGGSTFAQLLAVATDNDLIGASKDYFFMANTVASKAQGGAATTAPTKDDIVTLAKLDASKIYSTEEAAKANAAGDVYVERAVAKATMKYADALKVAGNNIGSIEWAINNTEPSSFVVRNMGNLATDYLKYSSEGFATNEYRMVGNTKFAAADLYRTYWCVDPQYSSDATLTHGASSYVAAAKGSATPTPLYCHENTFDVAHQNYGNTTRAVVKVTLETTTDFYAVNDGTTKYATADDAKAAAGSFVSAVINDARIKQFFKDNLVAGHSFTATAADFTLTYDEPAAGAAGYVKLSGITLNTTSPNLSGACPSDLNFADAAAAKSAFDALTTLSTIISEINADVKVKKFVGGNMWYTARFEHFANTAYEKGLTTFAEATAKTQGDLAPWNCWEAAGNKPAAGSTANSYPAGASKTDEENYLGRYGMVRNNWYDVQIDKIDAFGEPVDPSTTVDNPSTPDDNPESYISVKIYVLSWAKRTQSWSF